MFRSIPLRRRVSLQKVANSLGLSHRNSSISRIEEYISCRCLSVCLSIDKAFRFIYLFPEIWVFYRGGVYQVYVPTEQSPQCMIEIKEIIGIVVVIYLSIEFHKHVHIAVVIETGSEYGAEHRQ